MRPKGGGRTRITRVVVSLALVAGAPLVAASPAAASATCTFNVAAPPVNGVTPGTTIAIECSGLAADQAISVSEQSPLATIVSPSSSRDFEVATGSTISAVADSGGALSVVFNVPDPFAAADPAATCPPTQAQVDAGLGACTLVLRDVASGVPIVSPAQLVYAGQPTPSLTPSVSVSNGSSFVPGNVVALSGSGFWGGPSGSTPMVLFGASPGTPVAQLPITISATTYECDTDCDGTPGTLTPGGALSGSVTVPNATPPGPTTVSVVASNSTPFPSNGPFNTLVATTQITILEPANAVAAPNSGGVGTVVHVTGTGWDPQNPSATLSFLTPSIPGPLPTASALVDTNGNLSGYLSVSGLENPGVNPIVVTQGTVTAQASFTITDIVSVCTGAACEDSQVITQAIEQGDLTIAQDPTDIALGAVTLNGLAQHGIGQLGPLVVIDSRGSLVGWTVTATMQGDFQNAAAAGLSSNNTIPAQNLTWVPTVVLTAEGSGDLSQVHAGEAGALSTTTGATLCAAATGGGGGAYACNATLDLLIPGTVAIGTYSAVLNITVT